MVFISCNLVLIYNFSAEFNANHPVVVDINTALNNGIYYVNPTTINRPDSAEYAILIIFKTDTMRTQIYAPLSNTINPTRILIRSGNGNNFSSWQTLLTNENALISRNLAFNGYIHFGTLFGKLIIQWGRTNIQNVTTKITLNISMNTAGTQVYPVFMTNIDHTTNNSAVLDNDRFQSYFNVISSSNAWYYWLVIGL